MILSIAGESHFSLGPDNSHLVETRQVLPQTISYQIAQGVVNGLQAPSGEQI